jgi:diguanylate cyclase
MSEREQQAMTDALTGLPNRRAAEAALHREEARARRSKSPVSVAMIDIDNFKRVNDVHGHEAGDRVLAALGRLLAAQARASDTVARWGGEEFLAVVSGDADSARAYCERVRAALTTLWIGEVGLVTISAGVSLVDSHEEIAVAVQRADHRLYEAKRAGRDRVVSASATTHGSSPAVP